MAPVELLKRYKAFLLYVFFGVLTTAVNTLVYLLCLHPLACSNLFSTAVAWFCSVLFAYITNKVWVFESKSFFGKLLFCEIASFFSCRILTGALDLLIMYVAVDRLAQNELLWKLLSNVIVILLNYVASKFFVFHAKSNKP